MKSSRLSIAIGSQRRSLLSLFSSYVLFSRVSRFLLILYVYLLHCSAPDYPAMPQYFHHLSVAADYLLQDYRQPHLHLPYHTYRVNTINNSLSDKLFFYSNLYGSAESVQSNNTAALEVISRIIKIYESIFSAVSFTG